MKEKVISLMKDRAIWLVFILLFIGFAIANENFLSSRNLFTIARQVSMYGIASIGMTIVILTAGIDLSIGSTITFTNIVGAYLMVNSGLDMVTATTLALTAATLVGIINGFLISSIGITPIIATFATQTIFAGVSYLICGGVPIYGFDERYKIIGQGYLFGQIPVPVLIMIATFALGAFILNKSYFGRYFYAVGGNEEASKLSGINVGRIKYLAYALSGLFAGLAGIVMLSRTNSAQPTAGLGYEFDVITCVVLGGVSISGGFGKISNVVAGVLIIGVLTNGMVLMNVDTYMQMVVKGLVLAFAVGVDSFQKKRAIA